MEDEEDAALFGPTSSSQDAMNTRVQAAEKAAYEAQNAMLMMQQQLHQLCYMQQMAAQAGQVAPEAVPCAADAILGAMPNPAPSHVHRTSAGSPQLPKGVRNNALKAKNDKPKEKPVAPKDPEQVIDFEGPLPQTGGL